MAGNKNDFTQGSIVAKLLKFMIPILGSLILQAMYGAVDILVVGRFGTTAGISGVSTGSSIVNLVTFTITGLAMGVTVLIGQYLGEKKGDRVGRLVGGAIWLFLVLSVVLAVCLLVFARPLAILLQAPEEALDLTVLYVRICGGGIFFIIAFNVISGVSRGLGDSNMPLIFVGIACVVNILGDLLFVAVFHWNVVGAALATVMAQAVSVILSVLIIRSREQPFPMKWEYIRFSGEVTSFVKLGLFSTDAAVIARAAEYLKGFAPEAVVTSILFSFIGYYNGHSKTLFVMLQGLAQTFAVRLPMSYLMSIQPNASLTMIGLAAPCATVFGIALNLAYFMLLNRNKEQVTLPSQTD